MKKKPGFHATEYLRRQAEKFYEAFSQTDGKPVFLEFGGKPFSDYHAERVLPGYDPECKAEILRETIKLADVVMVVNALDILSEPDGRKPKGRTRGDSGLLYDAETIRIILDARKRQIPIDKVVLGVTPREITSQNKKKIDAFRKNLRQIGATLHIHYKVDNYPSTDIFEDTNPFEHNDVVRAEQGNLVVVSPGGGSGKFGVLLSEMYEVLVQGYTPKYLKFETFPIYQLDANHALNLAFEAATADLGNQVIDIRTADGQGYRTSYDKDIQNFALLKEMFRIFGKDKEIEYMVDSVDMGINRIIDGIGDIDQVVEACHKEIKRRILRYEREVEKGMEVMKTVDIARSILGRFEGIYKVKTN